MALCGPLNGWVVAAVVALILVPARYYLPEPAPEPPPPPRPPAPLAWLDNTLTQFPPLDLFVTFSLLSLGLFTYLCEWIQRKIMERRICKLNRYLSASVERLRARDSQQEQLENTLKLVQSATSEYNLLLYLLLRQHHCIASNCPPANRFFEKQFDNDPFLTPTEV